MSTIPLAKPFNRKAIETMGGPYGVSQKHDGVPVKLTLTVTDTGKLAQFNHCSRQGKALPSLATHMTLFIMSITSVANSAMKWPAGEYAIVAEVIHPLYPDFKDLSGIVRQQDMSDPRVQGLKFVVFDFFHDKGPADYAPRMFAANMLLSRPTAYTSFAVVDTEWYTELDDAIRAAEEIARIETVEGAILRSGKDTYRPGMRSWGYQKVLVDPTADLRVVSFEEAVSKDGVPLGMVGRINCEYKGETIGVGPGKLSHKERKDLWLRYINQDIQRFRLIAEVKYKRDPSYTALRQPTFQRWRDDKDEPNEEV